MSSLGAVVADFFFLGPLGLLGISLKMSPESPNKSSSPSGFTTFFGFRASVFLTENNSSSSSWKQLTNELKSNLRGNSYYSRIIHIKKKKTFQLLIRNVVTNMTYKSSSFSKRKPSDNTSSKTQENNTKAYLDENVLSALRMSHMMYAF